MDLTSSYQLVLPDTVLRRYELVETRNAAAVLQAADPACLVAIIDVLERFELLTTDLTCPGGNQSRLASRLNAALRGHGFREAAVDTEITLRLRLMPHRPAGETKTSERETTVSNPGFKTDGMLRRVAADVEWNAKDGHLDRDLAAYRDLYDLALVDAAVLITRTQTDLRDLAFRLRKEAGMSDEAAASMLKTSTTTNLDKLRPRLTRGDGGGCPVLGVCISAATWEGAAPV